MPALAPFCATSCRFRTLQPHALGPSGFPPNPPWGPPAELLSLLLSKTGCHDRALESRAKHWRSPFISSLNCRGAASFGSIPAHWPQYGSSFPHCADWHDVSVFAHDSYNWARTRRACPPRECSLVSFPFSSSCCRRPSPSPPAVDTWETERLLCTYRLI